MRRSLLRCPSLPATAAGRSHRPRTLRPGGEFPMSWAALGGSVAKTRSQSALCGSGANAPIARSVRGLGARSRTDHSIRVLLPNAGSTAIPTDGRAPSGVTLPAVRSLVEGGSVHPPAAERTERRLFRPRDCSDVIATRGSGPGIRRDEVGTIRCSPLMLPRPATRDRGGRSLAALHRRSPGRPRRTHPRPRLRTHVGAKSGSDDSVGARPLWGRCASRRHGVVGARFDLFGA